jgi:cation transport regulator ChaB
MARKKMGVNMPSTLERSPEKAQRTYAETLKHAEAEYGDEERAHRTAYASVKHGFKKVGDHWEAKPGSENPAAKSAKTSRKKKAE